jgi:ADP-ribose pyrophosphatase YjhB (NUDIX family)
VLFTYNFCPRCGAHLEMRQVQGKERPLCPACGLIIFLNPRLVAAVIPEAGGKVALVRRAMRPRRGTWVFPGGYVDQGETVEQAARREVWEETGLTVELGRMVGVYSREGEETVLVVYAGHVTGGQLAAGEEEMDAGWFSPDDLPPEDELGFWSTGQALADWKASESTADTR